MLIETNEYVDAVTASKILQVTRARVSTLCRENRFLGQVRVGHFWLIPRKSVEEYQRKEPGRKPKEEVIA